MASKKTTKSKKANCCCYKGVRKSSCGFALPRPMKR